MTVTYEDVRAYLDAHLRDLYEGSRAITYSPGPGGDLQAQKNNPGRMVFLEVGGGPGLHLEDTFDRVFITVRILGPQRDFGAAEELAIAVDLALVAFGSSADIAPGKRALFITRAGGRPQLLLRDSAERYHFTASYIGEFESGI